MILVFDVGNTETTVGLYDGEKLCGHWRVTTDVARTPGAITPPMNTPSAVMQSYVVAVPRSTTIVSRR